MKEFYIDFKGYCTVEAESIEEAEAKFWNGLSAPSIHSYDDEYDIERIEEKKS